MSAIRCNVVTNAEFNNVIMIPCKRDLYFWINSRHHVRVGIVVVTIVIAYYSTHIKNQGQLWGRCSKRALSSFKSNPP
jgi:hypothetical protein